MTSQQIKDRFPHYWLCAKCAEEKGGKWPEGHTATCIFGICQYCKDNNKCTLTPWVDYDWPGIVTEGLRD